MVLESLQSSSASVQHAEKHVPDVSPYGRGAGIVALQSCSESVSGVGVQAACAEGDAQDARDASVASEREELPPLAHWWKFRV